MLCEFCYPAIQIAFHDNHISVSKWIPGLVTHHLMPDNLFVLPEEYFIFPHSFLPFARVLVPLQSFSLGLRIDFFPSAPVNALLLRPSFAENIQPR